jgi:hypothetical protein
MSIASQVAYVLRDRCSGLSTEATAIVLDIELCPAPGARYRYLSNPARVEYDSDMPPAEQCSCIRRAVVYRVLDILALRLPIGVSMSAVVREVFEPTSSNELLLAARRQ